LLGHRLTVGIDGLSAEASLGTVAQRDSLGERLAALRVTAGLSQERLAEAANVSAKTIGDIERGIMPNPPAEALGRIADALGLTGNARAELLEQAGGHGAAEPTELSGRGQAPVGHAFISYVREDSHRVDWLQRELEAAGIPVWRDTADLWPGEDWRTKIRQAITDDALVFIACFSRASLARLKTYQNEELTLAIEQLRLRRPDDPWLIPVRLDECDIPDRDIGGGRTLASIQRADVFGDRSSQGVTRLIASILRILGQGTSPNMAPTAPERDSSGAEPKKRPWWRVTASRWRAAVIVPLTAVSLLAVGAYAVSQTINGQGSVTVTGSVICESGRHVVGVWIAASAGQSDSGFAHLGPPNPSGISFPIGAQGTYSYLLPHGGSYAVHVGCGGTAHHWASINYSPLLSSPSAHLRCNDPTTSAGETSPRGRCAVTAAS
jgi:transcriptional regulator with XRE-family HTH domain